MWFLFWLPGTEESSHEPNEFNRTRPQSIPDHDQLEMEQAIYDCEECRREYEKLTQRAEANRRQIYNLGLIARKEHPFVRFRRIKETPVQIIQNIISDIPSTLSTMSQFGRVTNVEKILANKLADFYTNNARVWRNWLEVEDFIEIETFLKKSFFRQSSNE